MLFSAPVGLLAVLSFFFQTSLSLAVAKRAEPNTAKAVVAHFMVGIVGNYEVADWKQDIASAQDTGIDGFALNCAPSRVDSYTPRQLEYAYKAAKEMNFKVFISFDFVYWNGGDIAEINQLIDLYVDHPAQMMYDGGALLSTFVGDDFDWAPVKAAARGKLTAIPNQQDPWGSLYRTTNFDGVFSWYAWPTTGGNAPTKERMTTRWDDIFLGNLRGSGNIGGSTYMAPVSPWFAPHFRFKNWVFVCEQLITDRWEQMLKMQPELIQVVSWNDYGESHYIGPWQPNHSDDGSAQWTLGFPHDGWRDIMKPYIAAYKAGATKAVVTQDQLVYWYRPTPKSAVCTGDSVSPPNGYDLLEDDVFITTMLTEAATLIVVSGENELVSIDVAAGVVTSNVPFVVGEQSFYLTRDGETIMSGTGGKEITDVCQFYNFNAYVGTLNIGDSIGPAPTDPSSSSSSTSMSSTTEYESSTTFEPITTSDSSTKSDSSTSTTSGISSTSQTLTSTSSDSTTSKSSTSSTNTISTTSSKSQPPTTSSKVPSSPTTSSKKPITTPKISTTTTTSKRGPTTSSKKPITTPKISTTTTTSKRGPTTSSKKPITTPKISTTTTTSKRGPTTSSKKPVTTPKTSTTTTSKRGPTTTSKSGPTTTSKRGATTTSKRGPTTSSKKPVTTQKPVTTSKRGPTTSSKKPVTTQKPVTTSKRGPTTSSKKPVTTLKPVTTSKRGPTTSSKKPVTSTKNFSTTTQKSSTRTSSTSKKLAGQPTSPVKTTARTASGTKGTAQEVATKISYRVPRPNKKSTTTEQASATRRF